jgi:hypothetical protein
VYGDPRITPFDFTYRTFASYKHGHFWLVRSTAVWIQGHYATANLRRPSWSTLRRFAIGGPFLQANTIVVDSSRYKLWFNSVAVDVQDIRNSAGTVATDSSSAHTFMGGAVRVWMGVQNALAFHAGVSDFTIEFPNHDITLFARINHPGAGTTRLQQMTLEINMKQISDQSGHCGNFNGDEAEEIAMSNAGLTGDKVENPNKDLLDNCD